MRESAYLNSKLRNAKLEKLKRELTIRYSCIIGCNAATVDDIFGQTLREELRKVQSSAALLERQRNPGLGYWAAKSDGTEARSPTSSVSDLVRESPRPASPSMSDEEVNFEYLRNVIMQFLEHQEMRVRISDPLLVFFSYIEPFQPHLVRILSTILHFTPQETRRLVAKV